MTNNILLATKSVCPVCLKVIVANYVIQDERVWFEKTCDEHGAFSVPVWEDPNHFQKWQRNNCAQAPCSPMKEIKKGCPYDCGLCKAHIQASCCVLLEVTERCNLHCPICYSGVEKVQSKPDPLFSTITKWFDMLLEQGGPFNIQLSGGEPTLRDDLPAIIQTGKEKGFHFFQLNTNGLRIAKEKKYLQELQAAGLSTVFLQFDGLQSSANKMLRGENLIDIKKQAIKNCRAINMPVVLVATVRPKCNLESVGELIDFAVMQMPTVRGIHFQPISYFGRYGEIPPNDLRTTVPMLLRALEKQTNGRVQMAHFSPASAEHAMCSFHVEYYIKNEIWVPQKIQSSCCTPSSDRARDAVALHWSNPLNACCANDHSESYDLSAIDDFLHKKFNHTLAISGMAFQDAWTLDLNRLKHCHVHIVSQQGDLIPFCAMNLTAIDGQSIYR